MQSRGHVIQVRSLTQFYSFGFLHTKISLTSLFLQTHNQGLRQLFGSPRLSTTNLTVSLYLWNSRSNTRGNVEAPWRPPCQLKKPFKAPRQGSCRVRKKRTIIFLWFFWKPTLKKLGKWSDIMGLRAVLNKYRIWGEFMSIKLLIESLQRRTDIFSPLKHIPFAEMTLSHRASWVSLSTPCTSSMPTLRSKRKIRQQIFE